VRIAAVLSMQKGKDDQLLYAAIKVETKGKSSSSGLKITAQISSVKKVNQKD